MMMPRGGRQISLVSGQLLPQRQPVFSAAPAAPSVFCSPRYGRTGHLHSTRRASISSAGTVRGLSVDPLDSDSDTSVSGCVSERAHNQCPYDFAQSTAIGHHEGPSQNTLEDSPVRQMQFNVVIIFRLPSVMTQDMYKIHNDIIQS